VKSFESWFATSPVASWLRVFAAVVLAMFIADGADVFAVDTTDLRAWLAAGLASALPLALRWLNPSDGVYGRNGEPIELADIWGDEDDEL